jgi:2-oxoglutarate ferredoxin oxidoreductase subunit alpha
MASYGDGYRFHVTGLSHGESGFPTNSPDINEALVKRLCSKVNDDADNMAINETLLVDDAEILIAAYGSVARTSAYVVKQLRKAGVKAGLFIPKVLWPFPEKAFLEAAHKAKHVIVPEMKNLGHMFWKWKECSKGKCPTFRQFQRFRASSLITRGTN